MEQYLLGVDVGTTGTKALLFRTDGTLVDRAYQAYPTRTPQVGWCEQDPRDWWQAVVQTVRQVCADPAVGQQVAAISLSTQGGTVAAVDKTGTPLAPAAVWNDIRCVRQKQALLQQGFTAAGIYETTGWALIDGLPLLQIRWLRENMPDLHRTAAYFLTVPDYISIKMTGIAAVDPSNAGINQLTDIRKGCYDPALLAFAGIRPDQLPTLVPSGEVIGRLTASAAAELGLSENCVLVSGAHDQYAVALGAGACQSGDILIGSGTCWVVTAISDAPSFRNRLSQSVAAVPGKWGSMLSLSSGGICLDWLRRNLPETDYETINREVAQVRAAEDGLFFFPFSGKSQEGASFRKATFSGLDLFHNRFHMARAIMEGVAFQTLWMLEAFPVQPSQQGLKLTGGASKSRVWSQITADIAGVPVRIPEVADLACVGAAILAGVGCGIYTDAADGYRHLAVREQILTPDPVRAEEYSRLKGIYRRNAAALGQMYAIQEGLL